MSEMNSATAATRVAIELLTLYLEPDLERAAAHIRMALGDPDGPDPVSIIAGQCNLAMILALELANAQGAADPRASRRNPPGTVAATPRVAASSRSHRPRIVAVAVCNRQFACAGVGSHDSAQDSAGKVGGPRCVAGPAADHEAAIGSAALGDFLDVVGGEVGREVGGLAFPPGAPVAHHGAVVRHYPTPTLAFSGVVVEVGSSLRFGSVVGALAVVAAWSAADSLAASSAGAEQATAHRGLRLRRCLSSRAQGWQRSPGPTNRFLQARQRPCAMPRNRVGPWLLPTAPEGEEDRSGASVGGLTDAHDPGPGVGRDPDDGDVVEGGPGPGNPAAIG
jgi:hypothetical protein